MLSTVVLPAPFGPITLVTLPGAAVKVTSVAALMPPKAMPRSRTSSAPGAAAGVEERADIESASSAVARSRRGHRRASRPTTPSGASHSTTSSSAPKNSSRYSARPDSSSGRTTLTDAPTTGPKRPAGAADDDGEQEQDRLRERKRIRRDEHQQRREDPAGEAGEHRREREGRGLDDHRIEADRACRDLGVAHRHHGLAPAAAGEAVEGVERAPASTTARIAIPRSAKISAPIDGGGMPIRPFAPPVRSRHSIVPCCDDEGEGDRHHREIGAADAQRRQREHDADDAGDGARERQREPEVDALAASGWRPCRRRSHRSRHGRARPARSVRAEC